jgi:hypothetical protein
MASGVFQDVEEVLLHALKSAPLPDVPSAKPFGRKLVEVFAEAREILGGIELDFTVIRLLDAPSIYREAKNSCSIQTFPQSSPSPRQMPRSWPGSQVKKTFI